MKLKFTNNKTILQNLEPSQGDPSSQMKAKAKVYDKYINYKGTYPIRIAANAHGLTSEHANHLLEKEKIQYKRHKRWFLRRKYFNHGLAKVVPFIINMNYTKYSLKWTNKGLLFASKIFEKYGYPLEGE